MSHSVVILAGGLATRLRPLTETLPKAMVDVCGKPFLTHQLALLKQQGLTNIVLCVGYEGEQIERYFGNGDRVGVRLRYSYDGETLLGTGGALQQALPLLDEVFMVLYGDSYLDMDYRPIMARFLKRYHPQNSESPLALMTVYHNSSQFDQSNVLFEEEQIRHYDKRRPTGDMHHIDWGLGILSKPAFEQFFPHRSGGPAAGGPVSFDLADLYQSLVSCQKLMGFEVFTRFYEMGSPQGLAELREWLQQRGKMD